MKCSRGDVVLVDYPFTDRTGSKVRPSLIVQTDSLNARIDDTILAAISRSTHRASATQLLIDIATAEGAGTGLRQLNGPVRKSVDLRPTADHRGHRPSLGCLNEAVRQLSASRFGVVG